MKLWLICVTVDKCMHIFIRRMKKSHIYYYSLANVLVMSDIFHKITIAGKVRCYCAKLERTLYWTFFLHEFYRDVIKQLILLIKQYLCILNFRIPTHLRCQFSFVSKVLHSLCLRRTRYRIQKKRKAEYTLRDCRILFPSN